MLYTGEWCDEGVAEDSTQAVHWLRQAAERGVAGATGPSVSGSMYLLAECLLEGRGVERDVEAAYAWFAVAGERGHRGARARILALVDDAGGERDAYASASGRKASQWVVPAASLSE